MTDYNPYSFSARRSRRTGAFIVVGVLLCGLSLIYGPLILSGTHSKKTVQREHGQAHDPNLAVTPRPPLQSRATPGNVPIPGLTPDLESHQSFARNGQGREHALTAPDRAELSPPVRTAYQSWVNDQSKQRYCSGLASALRIRLDHACPKEDWKRLGQTVAGRPIMGSFHLNAGAHSRILVIAGLRGNDITSARSVLHWAGSANSLEISWVFVPLANPDALVGNTPLETNLHGVTLNRNWSTDGWSHTARLQEPASLNEADINVGTHEGSEPEIKALARLITIYRPTRIIYLNSGDGVITVQGTDSQGSRWTPFLTAFEPPAPGSMAEYALEHDIDFVTVSLPRGHEAKKYAQLIWAKLRAQAMKQ